MWHLHEPIARMMKKYVFEYFEAFFYHFQPCKRMRKHAFAGLNTQHPIQIIIWIPDIIQCSIRMMIWIADYSMIGLTLWPGKAIAGSWEIPILARAWAACLFPLFVPSRARGSRDFEPPCCTTIPLSSGNLQMALSTRAINSLMFLLSFFDKATRAEATPHWARVWKQTNKLF